MQTGGDKEERIGQMVHTAPATVHLQNHEVYEDG